MVQGKLDLQKRQHRERAQPAHRKKLGLLEKHADYVKRARDFHSKEDRIQKLREKAAFRNKDEFYFAMVKAKTKKGVHIQSRGNEPLPTDLVKVLKTQDATYIRMQTKMEQGRIDRLREQLTSLVDLALPAPAAGGGKQAAERDTNDDDDDEWDMYSDDEPVASTSRRNHVVFTDDIETVRAGNAAALLRKRATPTALPLTPTSASASSSSSSSRTRKGKSRAAVTDAAAHAAELAAVAAEVAASAAAHRARLEQELAAREARLVQLQRASRELELQRALMARGAKQPQLERLNPAAERGARDDEWWMQGVKGAKGPKAGEDEGKLPMAAEGIKTGARVWKWKAQRKR
ncbi:hypothetical protein JCM3770_000416 [Rhodotorula araucariae]